MSKVNGVMTKPRPKATPAADALTPARFHVTSDRAAELQMGDLIDIQDGVNDPRIVARVVGTFAVGEDGEYLTPDAARAVVRGMTVRQLTAAFDAIMAEVNEGAVPNE